MSSSELRHIRGVLMFPSFKCDVEKSMYSSKLLKPNMGLVILLKMSS